jgi:hypothetical protein
VILTSELEWYPSVLDHTFKEDEQWGEAPTFKSQFDEIGDSTQRVILHHNTYFDRQDGTITDYIIDQCICATHMFTTIKDQDSNISYNAYQHAIAEAPNSTQVITPKTTVNVLRISNSYSPSLDGCLPTSYKRHLNIPPSMRDFLLVPC